MPLLKAMLAILLATVWLPVTAHCLLLETASHFEFLACCSHESPTSDHENECDTDACSVVENAQYKSTFQRLLVPPPSTLIAFERPAPLDTTEAPGVATGQPTSPPDLPARWQFTFRTALSPRAPSLVS